LRVARRRRFVGRGPELALFDDAISRAEPPFSVLFVHGPGGVGKTTLLERFAEAAALAGVELGRVDLGAIEPAPDALLDELAASLGTPHGRSPLDALASGPRRVLLIDTYELAAPIDGWIREQLLPGLSAETVVVLAGRNPPRSQWRSDPGWHGALRVISLRNLPPADARACLQAGDVPEALHERALALSHGHPLALSLLSELIAQRAALGCAELPSELGREPDLVRSLLESFLDGTPSDLNRRALYACALARFTDEALLRAALELEDAAEPFAWLRGLSFIEAGAHGAFPHELARDVLEADLRWRDPAAFEQMHGRIYQHMARRVRSGEGRERQRALMDWNFLMRANPFTAAFVEWKSYGSVYYDRVRAKDREAMLEIAALHEGPESAELVVHWLERQPEAFRVIRAGGAEAIGFGAVVALHEASEAEIAADPGTAAMWASPRRHEVGAVAAAEHLGADAAGEGVRAALALERGLLRVGEDAAGIVDADAVVPAAGLHDDAVELFALEGEVGRPVVADVHAEDGRGHRPDEERDGVVATVTLHGQGGGRDLRGRGRLRLGGGSRRMQQRRLARAPRDGGSALGTVAGGWLLGRRRERAYRFPGV
jgi:hypothetical protein